MIDRTEDYLAEVEREYPTPEIVWTMTPAMEKLVAAEVAALFLQGLVDVE